MTDLIEVRAGDLFPILLTSDGHHIQRLESPEVIRKMRLNWDDMLVGFLHLALLLDGEHKGKIHTLEGGCRVRAKADPNDGIGGDIDPDYSFQAIIEDLTVEEVARKFIGMSKGRKAIPKLDEYFVALTYHAEWAVRLQRMFEKHRLVAAKFPKLPNGSTGEIAAISACEAVLNLGARNRTMDDGEILLDAVLEVGLSAFPKGTSIVDSDSTWGISGDLVRALGQLISRNREKLIDGKTTESRHRLIQTLKSGTPTTWQGAFLGRIVEAGNQPGGGGRLRALDAVICEQYNKRLAKQNRLVLPPAWETS